MFLQRHFSCSSFRCTVCHSTLLPGSYTQGRDACSLICTHHTTDSKSPDLNQQTGSAENRPKCTFQAGYFSLAGLAITSVPHYTKKTEPQDRLVCKTAETESKEQQERNREVRAGENRDCIAPHLPSPSVKDRTAEGAGRVGPAASLADSKIQQEATKTQEPSELASACARVTEGSGRPVPAPRRTLVPVPAPRTKTSQTMNNSPAAGKWTLYLTVTHLYLCTFMTDWGKKVFYSLFLCTGSPSNQNKCSLGSPHM